MHLFVTVSGALATQSDAQNQVAFGVAMYAGSTVITLTGIWGVNVILHREKLTDDSNQLSSSTLSFFKGSSLLPSFSELTPTYSLRLLSF